MNLDIISKQRTFDVHRRSVYPWAPGPGVRPRRDFQNGLELSKVPYINIYIDNEMVKIGKIKEVVKLNFLS